MSKAEAASGDNSRSQAQDWTTSTKNTGSEVQVEAPSGESVVNKAASGETAEGNMPSMQCGQDAYSASKNFWTGCRTHHCTVNINNSCFLQRGIVNSHECYVLKKAVSIFFIGSIQDWTICE